MHSVTFRRAAPRLRVEVFTAGVWKQGEVITWSRPEDASWIWKVIWSPGDGEPTCVGEFPSSKVRVLDEARRPTRTAAGRLVRCPGAGHGMKEAQERQALDEVERRLAAKFPELPEQRIAEAVTDSGAKLASAKVRDFVPVLVEKEARELLEHTDT